MTDLAKLDREGDVRFMVQERTLFFFSHEGGAYFYHQGRAYDFGALLALLAQEHPELRVPDRDQQS